MAHSFRTGTGRYDPFATPSANDYLCTTDGRSRREADVWPNGARRLSEGGQNLMGLFRQAEPAIGLNEFIGKHLN
jgi:hypothetical protein